MLTRHVYGDPYEIRCKAEPGEKCWTRKGTETDYVHTVRTHASVQAMKTEREASPALAAGDMHSKWSQYLETFRRSYVT
jgi:hypothetical protein